MFPNNNNQKPQYSQGGISGYMGGGPDGEPLPMRELINRWGWALFILGLVVATLGIITLTLVAIAFGSHDDPCDNDDENFWKCPNVFDLFPPVEDCVEILYSSIATGIEFNLCYFGQCTYFKEAEVVLDWACAGIDSGRAETKLHGAKHCLDLISDGYSEKHHFQAVLVCIGGDALCWYHDACARYAFISEFDLESTSAAHSQAIHHRHQRPHDTLPSSSSISTEMSVNDAMTKIHEAKAAMGGKGLLEFVTDTYHNLKTRQENSALDATKSSSSFTDNDL